MLLTITNIILELSLFVGTKVFIFYIFYLILKSMVNHIIKSIKSDAENTIAKKSLGEAIKEYRTKSNMTQEFIAERIGVSRQAVSKWERGTSDPSTSNLFALADLFDITVEELLKGVKNEKQ